MAAAQLPGLWGESLPAPCYLLPSPPYPSQTQDKSGGVPPPRMAFQSPSGTSLPSLPLKQGRESPRGPPPSLTQPQGSVRTEAPRKAPGSPLEPSQPPAPGTGPTSIPGNSVSRPYPPTFLAHKPLHHFTIFKQHTIKKQVLVLKKG